MVLFLLLLLFFFFRNQLFIYCPREKNCLEKIIIKHFSTAVAEIRFVWGLRESQDGLGWKETESPPNFNPLLWAGCPPVTSGCPVPHPT